MKNNFSIFYSWQSDVPNNKNFVQKCIDKAIKNVKRKHSTNLQLTINIDRDTKGESGSPAIAQTIFRKINISDIFICDVTNINKDRNSRFTPNPNVLIELGYAIKTLGWERVICVCNTDFGDVEDLPFDIRGHRVTIFQNTDERRLIGVLSIAIERVILDFENILSKQAKSKHEIHDYGVYQKINEVCSESSLKDAINSAVSFLYIRKYQLNILDDVYSFYLKDINKFLDEKLDELANILLEELIVFRGIISTKFHSLESYNGSFRHYLSELRSGKVFTEKEKLEYEGDEAFSPQKEPFYNETYDDARDRIFELQGLLYEHGEKVKGAYRNLIMEIKRKLL